MKKVLNPKLQKEMLIEIEESSSEAETQSKQIEGMISKALEIIEENIKSILDISVKKVIDKGKGVMSTFSEETNKKQSCIE